MVVKSRELRRYRRAVVKPGDVIDASAKDAAFFRKTKWAEDAAAEEPPVPVAPPVAVQFVRRRQATPAPVVAAEPEQARVEDSAAGYTRRDMRPAD